MNLARVLQRRPDCGKCVCKEVNTIAVISVGIIYLQINLILHQHRNFDTHYIIVLQVWPSSGRVAVTWFLLELGGGGGGGRRKEKNCKLANLC